MISRDFIGTDKNVNSVKLKIVIVLELLKAVKNALRDSDYINSLIILIHVLVVILTDKSE